MIFDKTGRWTGDDLLQMLIEHPATSQRLAFRICQLLMGESSATDEIVDELAAGLRRRELDIGWAVETVLRSEAFYSNNNIGNRVRGPVEFVIGAIMSLEITDPPPSTLLLAETTAHLGQDLFYPPNVFGWPGGRSWLTSRALIGRANFASALINGELHRPPKPFDAKAFAAAYGFHEPEDIGTVFVQLLLGQTQLPAEFQQYVATPNRLVTGMLASPEAQLA